MYLIPPWRSSLVATRSFSFPGQYADSIPDVLVEVAAVGVLDIGEVVRKFLVGEEVFDDRLGVGILGDTS